MKAMKAYENEELPKWDEDLPDWGEDLPDWDEAELSEDWDFDLSISLD